MDIHEHALKQLIFSRIYGSLWKYNQIFYFSVEKGYYSYSFLSLAYKNKSLDGATSDKLDIRCAIEQVTKNKLVKSELHNFTNKDLIMSIFYLSYSNSDKFILS